jgi:hypothetical protein
MSLLRFGALSLNTCRRRTVPRTSIWRAQTRFYASPLPKKLSEPMADAYDPVRYFSVDVSRVVDPLPVLNLCYILFF